jgi:branched-chain amino acid transport system substrate-binding protein
MNLSAVVAGATRLLLAFAFSVPAHGKDRGKISEKISDGVVKIGMIEDMSSLYADVTGIGAVTATRMAIQDFGRSVLGKPIQLVFADHHNKPNVASSIARQWFDYEASMH